MGVQLYLLDRRSARLVIGDTVHDVGILRRFWKITEVDGDRSTEIETAKLRVAHDGAPKAVLIGEVVEMASVGTMDKEVPTHLVLGWDVDRAYVSDWGWDYLPVLGYAVRDTETGRYVLQKFEEDDGPALRPFSTEDARAAGLLDAQGNLVRWGQPVITGCREVAPFIKGYVQADCSLSNGQDVKVMTSTQPDHLPDPAWYLGKRPVDVAEF